MERRPSVGRSQERKNSGREPSDSAHGGFSQPHSGQNRDANDLPRNEDPEEFRKHMAEKLKESRSGNEASRATSGIDDPMKDKAKEKRHQSADDPQLSQPRVDQTLESRVQDKVQKSGNKGVER